MIQTLIEQLVSDTKTLEMIKNEMALHEDTNDIPDISEEFDKRSFACDVTAIKDTISQLDMKIDGITDGELKIAVNKNGTLTEYIEPKIPKNTIILKNYRDELKLGLIDYSKGLGTDEWIRYFDTVKDVLDISRYQSITKASRRLIPGSICWIVYKSKKPELRGLTIRTPRLLYERYACVDSEIIMYFKHGKFEYKFGVEAIETIYGIYVWKS